MPVSSDLDPVFEEAGREWNVDPRLLRAIAVPESSGNARAVSPKGAQGLMQIMPDTGRGLGVTNPFDPVQSIWGGAKYMAQALDAEKTPEDALRFYHGGPDWRASYGPESRAYVPLVAAAYQRLAAPPGATGAAVAQARTAPKPDATDDFLSGKTSGAPAPAAAPPAASTAPAAPDATDDFLTGKGSTPPAAAAAAAFRPETAETRRIGNLMTPGPPSSSPAAAAPTVSNALNIPGWSGPPNALDIGQVGQAVRQGYDSGAGFVTPAGVSLADQAGLGFIPRGINLLSGAAGAIGGGAVNVLDQAAGSLIPGASRDLAQGINLASPFVMSGAANGGSLLRVDTSRAFRDAARLDRVAPLPADFKANPLSPEYAGPSIAPGDVSANPNPGTAPRPATPGAAPPTVIPNGLTPEQIAEFTNIPDSLPPTTQPIKTPADAAARADEIINHFASIGNRIPIPGAVGALPTITGNAGLATLYRAVRDSDTPVPFTSLENASKTDAMGQLRTMAGTPEDLTAAKDTRATTVKPMYDAAWANKTEADPSGPIQKVQDFIKSPAKQNDTVMAELPGILKKLQGETDPEQLKGISDNIDATLQRLGTEGKADRETRRVLGAVKDSITPAISDAAPGFDAAQAEFSRQSRRIDEMTYLQGRKLTDLQGNPTLGNMRSTLDDITKKQAGDKFNPADSVTPENMKNLQRLHDQMQREQLTQTAGKSLGSTTFQNLATNSRIASLTNHVGNALAGGVIGGGIDLLSGGGGMTGLITGNALGGAAKYYAGRSAATTAARAEAGQKMLMQALRERLLNVNNAGINSLNGSRR